MLSGAELAEPADGPPRGAIVTAAGPQMLDVLFDLALPTFKRYASRWRWVVQAKVLPNDGAGADPDAQHAKWFKIQMLREALQHYPMALWLDADVLVLRDDDDILAHLHPRSFQAFVLEHVPSEHRINPNTGVWLLRSCPKALSFLDAVERAGPQPGPWADQGAVLAALGWERGDERYNWARPGHGSEFLPATGWLPPGWNAPYVRERSEEECFNSTAASYADRPRVDRPQAMHFMGMTAAARYRHMKTVAQGGIPLSVGQA